MKEEPMDPIVRALYSHTHKHGASGDHCYRCQGAKRIEHLALENEALRVDAERYRWLKSRSGLELRSDRMLWEDLRTQKKFVSTHYLAEGGTQHAAEPSLDETIDAAMVVAANRGM
jgi:hypothetical protein